jgi:hypothetical protein
MKKFLLVTFTFLLLSQQIFAQQIRPLYGLDLQFGANAPVWGLKVHRNFYLNKESHITFGTGVGVGGGRRLLTIMNDLTYSIGKSRHFVEVGAVGFWSAEDYFTNDFNIFGTKIGNGNYIVAPLVGYKYVNARFVNVRLHFTPIIKDTEIYPWGGISVGFHFRKKYQEKTDIGSVRFSNQ